MNSFNTQIHSDESRDYRPTAADLQEYAEFVDSQEQKRANAWQDHLDSLQQTEFDYC